MCIAPGEATMASVVAPPPPTTAAPCVGPLVPPPAPLEACGGGAGECMRAPLARMPPSRHIHLAGIPPPVQRRASPHIHLSLTTEFASLLGDDSPRGREPVNDFPQLRLRGRVRGHPIHISLQPEFAELLGLSDDDDGDAFDGGPPNGDDGDDDSSYSRTDARPSSAPRAPRDDLAPDRPRPSSAGSRGSRGSRGLRVDFVVDRPAPTERPPTPDVLVEIAELLEEAGVLSDDEGLGAPEEARRRPAGAAPAEFGEIDREMRADLAAARADAAEARADAASARRAAAYSAARAADAENAARDAEARAAAAAPRRPPSPDFDAVSVLLNACRAETRRPRGTPADALKSAARCLEAGHLAGAALDDLHDLDAALSAAGEHVRRALVDRAAAMEDEIVCGICRDDRKTIVFSNCGHCCCERCAGRVDACPFCRGPKSPALRFHL